MPQDRGTPLARFAQAIAAEDGFSFGRPSLSDDGSTVTVPILQTHGPTRRYVLAQEVWDSISAVDSGRLDRLRVHNASAVRVFFPPGTLFVGRETPSRGTVAGILLEPGSEVDVEVKCVHASQRLTPGAALQLAVYIASDELRRALVSRDQGWVWTMVREGVGNNRRTPAAGPSHRPTRVGDDDLLASLTASSPAANGPDLAPRGLVSDNSQCGMVILDAEGVRLLETYASPESWNVASPLARTHTAEGIESNSIPGMALTLDPTRAVQVAKEFLLRVGAVEYRHGTPCSWSSVDSASEYTEFEGDVLHLIAFGSGNLRPESYTRAPSVSRSGWLPGTEPEGPILGSSLTMSTPASGDGETTTLPVAAVEPEQEPEPERPEARPRRRKVLTSGWDAPTFESLERYSQKEFGGDRSAAMRFLVRQGLDRRGYLGPRSARPIAATWTVAPTDEPAPDVELGRAAIEARIQDFERIVQTDAYADWLRARARVELERMAGAAGDESLRVVAQAALDRLPAPPTEPEPSPPVEEEAPPLLPPVDVRPILRRAFSASAGGRYSEALLLFDEALDAEPDNRTALLGRAVALRRSGKAAEALAALDLVLRLEPANAAALLNRGRVLQERGDLQGALETFDRLAVVAPNDWDVWMARGDVLVRMGQDRGAFDAYSEALRRNPDDESIQAKIRALERIRLAPASSPAPRPALPRDVQEGQSFLVKAARPDLGYRVLRTLAVRQVPSLVLTHQPAETLRATQGLGGTRVLELSHAPGEGHLSPTSLVLLTKVIERFVEENHGHAVILLDGLGALIAGNGFRDTVLFVERVHEVILQSQAIFLICVAPDDLSEREAAILERNLRVLT